MFIQLLCYRFWCCKCWFIHMILKYNELTISYYLPASLLAQTVKNLPAMQETWVRFLGQEDPLDKGMVTHSRILVWQIRGAWQATVHMVSKSPGHDWATNTFNTLAQHHDLIFYTLQNDHQGRSSYRLRPYEAPVILLTTAPMVYITSLWLICFIAGSVCFSIPFIHFTHSHNAALLPFAHQLPVCSLCPWACFVFYSVHLSCFLYSSCKWDQMTCVFL